MPTLLTLYISEKLEYLKTIYSYRYDVAILNGLINIRLFSGDLGACVIHREFSSTWNDLGPAIPVNKTKEMEIYVFIVKIT